MLTQINKKVTITPLGLDIDSDLTFEEWGDLAVDIGSTLKSMSFVIGDWLIYGEQQFATQQDLPGMNLEIDPSRIRVSGDRYEATQAATGLDPATLKSYAYVSRRVPRLLRNNLLSWEHHKVVAKLNPAKQETWLETAASGDSGKRISVRRLRESITSGRVLSPEEMFRGTLTQTSVYPREVVKRSLANNAAAVIFAHNHPSGVAEPSHADETQTQALKQSLALVDVRVLDHFIVAGSGVLSFAERGLL